MVGEFLFCGKTGYRLWSMALVLGVCWAPSLVGAQDNQTALSEIIIINGDGPGEGFNDPTPVEPVEGNPATTLGAQRLAVIEAAADVWERVLISPVPITVEARFDELDCNAQGALLGFAGPVEIFRDFPGAQTPGTWFPSAQANQQAGFDLIPDLADIDTAFNSRLGQPGCLDGFSFFLGIGEQVAPENTNNLFVTAVHELAHGLGFLSLVDVATGQRFLNTNDIFSTQLRDATQDLAWRDMTDEERAASIVNTGNLQWAGQLVSACAGRLLNEGRGALGRVRMFAPDPAIRGSSVSHFDTTLTPDELMEPFDTGTFPISDLTIAALTDMGWPIQSRFRRCQAPRNQTMAEDGRH